MKRSQLQVLYGLHRPAIVPIRLDEAREQWEIVVHAQPGSVEAHFGLGNVFVLQQRWPDAVREFEIVLRLKPDLAVAQARLERFRQAYPHSPYAPAAASLAARVQSALGGRQREREMAAQQAALVGKPAPTLAVKDLEGKEQTLGNYRGKIILLNVFASW